MLRALPRTLADPTLDELLARVSRSFYLSLAVMPRAVREQLSLVYLVARAADTIADTGAVRRERRRELLGELRGTIAALADGSPDAMARVADLDRAVRAELVGPGQVAEERVLLERLHEVLPLLGRAPAEDRARGRRVLDALATGMERDLDRFDGERLTALATLDDLDEHCYLAAGCVGEYWTAMTAAHLPAARHLWAPDLVERGVRLGKALQLVNVLRDAPADLAAGRCYLPSELLERHGLAPADLRDPARRAAAAPAFHALVAIALAHLDAAWAYVMATPATAPRLRLACVWPLWIGLETLALLARARDPLDPAARRKVARRDVHRLMAESAAVVMIDPLLERRHRGRRARVA